MSNQIDTLIPRITARSLLAFREQAILPRLVNASFSAEAARRGDVIDVPVSSRVEVSDVTPSHTPPAPPDSSVSSVPIALNNWKKASFYLTDQEMMQIEADESFLPLQMREAVLALARAVNQSILDLHCQIPSVIGTPNHTPFAPPPANAEDQEAHHGVAAAITARKMLNAAGAPKTGRFAIINYDAEANALGLPQFADATKAGSDSVPMEGELGRKFGIDWFSTDEVAVVGHKECDLAVRQHTKVGDKTLSLTLGQGRVQKGMLLKLPESDQLYTVTGLHNTEDASAQKLSVSPAIDIVTTKVEVTPYSHVPVNMILQRDAIALAMRPLTSGGMETGSAGQMMSITDPQTGLSLRLEVSRQYKQTVWELDILWGVALLRPDWAVRLVG